MAGTAQREKTEKDRGGWEMGDHRRAQDTILIDASHCTDLDENSDMDIKHVDCLELNRR